MATAGSKPTVEETIARFRGVYELINRGDVERVLDSFADGAVAHFNMGDARGKREIRGFLSGQATQVDEQKFEPDDVLVSGQHVVALISSTVRKGNQTFSGRLVHAYKLDSQGKIGEMRVYADRETIQQILQTQRSQLS